MMRFTQHFSKFSLGAELLRIATAVIVSVACFVAIQRVPLHHASLVVILTSNDGVVLASESMGVSSDGKAAVYNQQKIFPISTKSALVITGLSGYPSENGIIWLQDAIKGFVAHNRTRFVNARLEKQTQMVSDFVVEFLNKHFLSLPASLKPRMNHPIVMFVIVTHDLIQEQAALRLHRFWYSQRSGRIRVEVQTSPVVKDRSTMVAFGSGGRAFKTIYQQLFFGKDRKYEQLRALPLIQRIKKSSRSSSISSVYVPLADGTELCRMIIGYAIDHWKEFEEGKQTIGGPIQVAVITPQRGFQWAN